MNKNFTIYKEYIGKQNEIFEISKWFKLYHHTILSIIKKNKNETYINEKLKKLQIIYKYKNNQSLYETIDLNIIEKIYNDFVTQLNLFQSSSYSDFSNLENDKLIILNIIESYFDYIKSVLNDKKSKQFYKNSIYRFSLISPKSKEIKILNKFLQNSVHNLSFLFLFSFVCAMLTLFYMSILIKILPIIINLLPKSVLQVLTSYSQTTELIPIFIIYFLALLSLLSVCFVLNKFKRFIITKLLPEKKIAYERDKSEKESTLSIISIIISIVSLVISIIFNTY